MAKSAGIINRDGPVDDVAFRDVIAGSSKEVQELALAVRGLVFSVLPQTVEVVWPKQGSIGWGTGPKKFSEQFAYLMPFTRHITLGFYRGGGLADPSGLLRAGGRQVSGTLSMRSLKITRVADVDEPALRALVAAAAQERITAFDAAPAHSQGGSSGGGPVSGPRTGRPSR